YNKLMLTVPGIEGAKRILNFYKSGISVKFEKEHTVSYIHLFDFDNIDNNEFIVTRQAIYDGRERIRTDLMMYVNGIPLVDIECKNPASISESWYSAYNQIKDYEKIVPELYKYVQIGVAAESQAKYFPIVPWQDDVKISEWKEEGKDSIDSTVEMFSCRGERFFAPTLLDILKNFLFFRIEHGNATKVIARYMQYRAANKIVNRVRKFIESKETGGNELKNKGLIWHWQGSGKTLTMIFAANKLFRSSRLLKNPTIFFIVDRVELEDQLSDEFNALDIVKPETIGSVSALKELIKHDNYRGKRGIFITLIHKFREEELKELQKEIGAVSETRETLMNRKNVIAFIDEGHRTQYGLLAAQMKDLLKGASFFAFTGTPISKKGRDTYVEFSYPPDEKYLDKYFITDSIKDGFTVKIIYQPRLEKEAQLNKDMLQTFLDSELEEFSEDIKDSIEERVKKRLNAIKLFLENPNRIKIIAEDIASHFKENIDGKFKAMVVAGSRKACAYYKQELDKHLPEKYSEIIMSYRDREPETIIQNSAAEIKAQSWGKNIEDIRKETIDKFKDEELPKILIVTDMLLAGFDAPELEVMYLDKPLKEHRLLQAVARTNRPFKDLKEAGLIIDYVGVLGELKRALEMYSKEDIKDALISYESFKEAFVELLEETMKVLKEVPVDYERSTLLKAVEVLTADKEKEKAFVEKYKNLRKLFELLGADGVKIQYLGDFRWLSAIYTYYRKVVVQESDYETDIQKYYDKTIKFIHASTDIAKLEKSLPQIAFDGSYLDKLEERIKDREEKAANIVFTLNKLVLVERHMNPIYESLIEKVERLMAMWREKTRDYEKIYTGGVNILQSINTLFKRKESLGFSDTEYAILLELENKLGKESNFVEKVKDISKRLKEYMFPGWINQSTAKKDVEREMRRFVRSIKSEYNLSLKDMDELHENLMERVKNYGA
ncbi:MAG: HsdR family type I site-specific deoxyribonuclease, partial [Deltaproteobacteria bacterium]|nr:HsdR family type I site-specific deoxyribonuclease [Deltaproteobacteria bacterium]